MFNFESQNPERQVRKWATTDPKVFQISTRPSRLASRFQTIKALVWVRNSRKRRFSINNNPDIDESH